MSNASNGGGRSFKTVEVRGLVFVFALLITFNSFAQQINTDMQDFRNKELVFNEDFIKLYKIRSIATTNYLKKNGKPLVTGYTYFRWTFDMGGKVRTKAKTIPNMLSQSIDTITYVLRYDHKNNLTHKVERADDKITSSHYTHDLNNVLTKSKIVEQISFGSTPEFDSREDSYTYEIISDTVSHKSTFNEEGTKYREEIIISDKEGKTIEQRGRYMRGYIRTKEMLHYNSKGLLDEKTIYQDVDRGIFEKYKLEYNNLDNINKIIGYKREDIRRQIDFLYFENSIILEAIIDQDIDTHDLNILKFEYEFYDGFNPFGD